MVTQLIMGILLIFAGTTIFYSWRGFNTPLLCGVHKGIKSETNFLIRTTTPLLCGGVVDISRKYIR